MPRRRDHNAGPSEWDEYASGVADSTIQLQNRHRRGRGGASRRSHARVLAQSPWHRLCARYRMLVPVHDESRAGSWETCVGALAYVGVSSHMGPAVAEPSHGRASSLERRFGPRLLVTRASLSPWVHVAPICALCLDTALPARLAACSHVFCAVCWARAVVVAAAARAHAARPAAAPAASMRPTGLPASTPSLPSRADLASLPAVLERVVSRRVTRMSTHTCVCDVTPCLCARMPCPVCAEMLHPFDTVPLLCVSQQVDPSALGPSSGRSLDTHTHTHTHTRTHAHAAAAADGDMPALLPWDIATACAHSADSTHAEGSTPRDTVLRRVHDPVHAFVTRAAPAAVHAPLDAPTARPIRSCVIDMHPADVGSPARGTVGCVLWRKVCLPLPGHGPRAAVHTGEVSDVESRLPVPGMMQRAVAAGVPCDAQGIPLGVVSDAVERIPMQQLRASRGGSMTELLIGDDGQAALLAALRVQLCEAAAAQREEEAQAAAGADTILHDALRPAGAPRVVVQRTASAPTGSPGFAWRDKSAVMSLKRNMSDAAPSDDPAPMSSATVPWERLSAAQAEAVLAYSDAAAVAGACAHALETVSGTLPQVDGDDVPASALVRPAFHPLLSPSCEDVRHSLIVYASHALSGTAVLDAVPLWSLVAQVAGEAVHGDAGGDETAEWVAERLPEWIAAPPTWITTLSLSGSDGPVRRVGLDPELSLVDVHTRTLWAGRAPDALERRAPVTGACLRDAGLLDIVRYRARERASLLRPPPSPPSHTLSHTHAHAHTPSSPTTQPTQMPVTGRSHAEMMLDIMGIRDASAGGVPPVDAPLPADTAAFPHMHAHTRDEPGAEDAPASGAHTRSPVPGWSFKRVAHEGIFPSLSDVNVSQAARPQPAAQTWAQGAARVARIAPRSAAPASHSAAAAAVSVPHAALGPTLDAPPSTLDLAALLAHSHARPRPRPGKRK